MLALRAVQFALLAGLACLLGAVAWLFFHDGQADRGYSSGFSGDGQFLARSTFDRVTVYDISTGQAWPIPDEWGHVALSPDGNALVCGGNGSLTVWDWRPGRKLHSWPGDNRWTFRIAISPDGKCVAGADDRAARVWILETGALIASIPLGFEHSAFAFSPDGHLLIAAGTELRERGERHHEIKVWKLPGGESHRVLTGPEYCYVRSLAVSPDGRRLATGLSVNAVRLWDLATGKELWKADDIGNDYDALAFSADSKRIAVGGWGAGTILDAERGTSLAKFEVPNRAAVKAVAQGSDAGKFLVAAGGMALEVDAESGRVAVIRDGLTLRDRPIRSASLAFAIWAGCWYFAYRAAVRRLAPEAKRAETYAFVVVLAVAAFSAGHWAVLGSIARGDWHGSSPIAELFLFQWSWPLGGCFLVAAGIGFRRSCMAVVCTAFCLFALTGQWFFECWLLGEVIASV